MRCLLLAALLLGAAAASGVEWDDVDALYAQARFDEAREALNVLYAAPHDTLRAELWRYRLATATTDATDALALLLTRPDLSRDLRNGLLDDAAWRAFAAREDEQALAFLREIPAGEETRADAGYLSGLVRRALGDPEHSAAALASVRQDDPDFAWARLQLASLAAAGGDPALARRYLQNAEEVPGSPAAADALALRWTLVRDADPRAAERVQRELVDRFPRSMAAARVASETRRREELAQAPAFDPPPAAKPVPAVGTTRFALQLAAFGDRGRAIAFRDAWRDLIPDLRVAADRDEHGRDLYRVRAGRFATRPEAAALAEALRRDHDLESLVVQVEESP
jgi:hypothetical protein